MPSGRTVLLFTRAPEVEARAKRLPLAEGACLFAGFLRGWQDRARGAGADLLVVTPASSQAALARLLPQASIAAQAGESFAARIEAAFALAFERGASTVLMVGGDGPPLEPSDIHAAFAHLESHNRAFALTPSDDGGVNAIGFNAQAERPLSGIAWQSSDVFRQLTSEGLRCGLALFLTSSGYDLDGAANVAAAIPRQPRRIRMGRLPLASSIPSSGLSSDRNVLREGFCGVLCRLDRHTRPASLLHRLIQI